MVGGEPGIQRRFKLLERHLDSASASWSRRLRRRPWGAGHVGGVGFDRGVTAGRSARGMQEQQEAVVPGTGERRIRKPGGGRKKAALKDPSLVAAWSGWSSRRRGAIRSRRCGGPARASASWPSNSNGRATRRRTNGERVAARDRLQPAGQPQDHGRDGTIRTATPSSSTSTARCGSFQTAGQPVDLGGHQEEGTGRRLQERRAGNGGPRANPEEVRVHDFMNPELGKAIPYGVYDLAGQPGWVSVGIDHDTAEFAVETHPPLVAEHRAARCTRRRKRLLITADGGGQQRQPRPALESWNCRSLADETGPADLRSATSRRAPASGTRSSTGCSPSSPELARPAPGEPRRSSST